ncbi:uncharacterized protein LOC113208659 [Frankliniella occidentalis]|uniref:Uncharacterized protein LOC113208659 n=1 Tax=Frankliniella occidentalis TaxID=133901 RepID=A0A9C6TW12_FRAOC|nr:uncharacterized protein LOC113208659 [Frankliniella occidentalis]XP_052121296.1 uncharacterized protein LOC113208659 [Frankliniella occidentalis]XP_052121297.1 uncharacterized protein LOC113208659 [Frankliniella occidentalis]XP_052121298.1 uncharacterized protein LOC113208659 [Frankliniella occidentalis]XP_052121299.1 uncharacterized protein LOC113208659 [Frankliniella occidentalis]
MEFSEAFRAEDIAKTDFFDFVVTPEDMGTDIVLHNNFPAWSRKSMGLFASNNGADAADDPGGNGSVNSDGAHPTKEANNNSILPNFADDSFWDTGGGKAAFAAAAAAVNIKMESPTLEDINDICWSSNVPADQQPQQQHQPDDDQGANQREEGDAVDGSNTDGSIYTLTVVNGQEPPPAPPPPAAPSGGAGAAPEAPPLWYRPPDLSSILREGDEQLRQAMSSMDPSGQCGEAHQYQTSLDIDSIISILPSLGSGLGSSLPEGLDHGLFSGPPDPGLHHSDDLLGSSAVCDDSGFVESKEDGQLKQPQQPSSSVSTGQGGLQDADDRRQQYSENNNDWAFSNHNENNESLLRSALQGGKAYLNQYNDTKTLTELGPPGMFMGGDMLPTLDAPVMMFDDMYGNGPASAASQCTSTCTSTTCMDDILLSPLDDYEKLKMIENEVAESAKRYGMHHYGPPPAPAPHSSTPPARPKKKASRRSGDRPPAKPKAASSGAVSSSSASTVAPNGARRERSLHHCTICSKAFKDKYSVNVHIRTHTGEKPFACSVCGKSFRQKAHLAKHYHTHIVQKSELPAKGLSTKAR